MKSYKHEYPDRVVYVNKDGFKHREDGPAIEYHDGSRSWWKDGNLHRLDGPAAEFDGVKYWYLNGKFIPVRTQEEFERYLKLIVFQ